MFVCRGTSLQQDTISFQNFIVYVHTYFNVLNKFNFNLNSLS